jgi:hypothetical protein
MASSSPRPSPRLVAEIDRLARRDFSFADINRRVGRKADALGLPRPSYESIRLLAHAARDRRAGPGTLEIVADVAIRARSPRELLDHASGLTVRDLDPVRRRRK